MNPVTGGLPQDNNPQPQPSVNPAYQPPIQPQPVAQQPLSPVAGVSQPQPVQQQVSGAGQVQQQAGGVTIPQLDDAFLQSIGLGVLPDIERSEMLQQMRKTLESNVGMEIYKNLQEYQLAEFEGFMPLNDDNGHVVNSPEDANANAQKWLDSNVPTWRTNPELQGMLQNPTQIQNFAAMNWLQKNFPGYRSVVSAEMTKLMTEVRNNVPQIVEAVMGPQGTNTQNNVPNMQQNPQIQQPVVQQQYQNPVAQPGQPPTMNIQ